MIESISIVREYLGYKNSEYTVSFFSRHIHTIVTSSASAVDNWIYLVEATERQNFNDELIVGLDTEWRPNFIPNTQQNQVAIIQLCVGSRCLIFQMLHCEGFNFPFSLIDFLGDTRNTFMGVGVGNDALKLRRDFGLEVGRTMDLGWLANQVGMICQRQPSLTTLIREVMNIEYVKPRNVTVSSWDSEFLSLQQVQYACIDAFVSYEIGRILMPMLQS